MSGRYRNEWRQWLSCTDSCWVDGPVMGWPRERRQPQAPLILCQPMHSSFPHISLPTVHKKMFSSLSRSYILQTSFPVRPHQEEAAWDFQFQILCAASSDLSSSVRKLGSLQQPDWRYNLAVSEGVGKGGRQSRGEKRFCGSFSVFLSECGTLETLLLPSCNNMAILGKSPLHRGDPARDTGKPDWPVLFWALCTGRIYGKDLLRRK